MHLSLWLRHLKQRWGVGTSLVQTPIHSSTCCRLYSGTALPLIRGIRNNGAEEDIPEDQLYSYSRYRWLCHEEVQLAKRYRRFNLRALVKIAVANAGGNARYCTKVTKCLEGQYNKVLLLEMDNGTEVVAKIPNPNAGPEFFLIASEVATRAFLRDHLSIPIPAVVTWCSTAKNPVGAEYIIEEKAHGVPLGHVWDHWPADARTHIIEGIVEIEAKLASISFPKHGCIYFKNDFQEKVGLVEDLSFTFLKDGAVTSSQYVLGPLTEAGLWEAEREHMSIDRGPWSHELEYVRAMGESEIQWMKAYAKPRLNCHRSIHDLELPEDHLNLLDRYMQLAPYLIPPKVKELRLNSLSHNDLHLDNIFVDPKTKRLTHIIDWQATSVSALFWQGKLPRMITNAHRQTLNTQTTSNHETPPSDLVSVYKKLCRAYNPLKNLALEDSSIPVLTKPVELVVGAWTREDIFSLRHALITLVAHWPHLFPERACPVSFSVEELQAHDMEMELLEGLGTILHQLNDEGMIPLGGMVPREEYESAQATNEYFRTAFIDLAEDEDTRKLHAQVWPYQDM